MFGLGGILRYPKRNTGRFGEEVKANSDAAFSHGLFTVAVHVKNADATREIPNRRFNYKSRDSTGDLLARDKWESGRREKFTGNLYPQSPRITGVARELTAVALTCSWSSAFCVVEYKAQCAFY